jgi:hypothetical protein
MAAPVLPPPEAFGKASLTLDLPDERALRGNLRETRDDEDDRTAVGRASCRLSRLTRIGMVRGSLPWHLGPALADRLA